MPDAAELLYMNLHEVFSERDPEKRRAAIAVAAGPSCNDGVVDERRELHAGANEAVLREVNEAIERGLWPGEEGARATFRCECSRLECAVFLSLAPRDYERVRAGSRRFVVTPGHENPAIETVVEQTPDYVVVEKRGEAGQVADASDPRP